MIDKAVPQGVNGQLDKAQVDWLRLMPDGWDGQPFVRCRDCRSYRASDATCHAWQWSNWDEAVEVEPDGFCAWGKRRDG